MGIKNITLKCPCEKSNNKEKGERVPEAQRHGFPANDTTLSSKEAISVDLDPKFNKDTFGLLKASY